VYRRDPKIAAEALDLSDADWKSKYGDRPRTDTFCRNPETGSLEQEIVVHPPNPAILLKLLTSLAPEIYGEKSTVEHVHSGAVWVEGAAQQGALPPSRGNDFNRNFGLTTLREDMKRPTNMLAVPRPCANSNEFDKRFRKKLLRNVTLFRNTDGKLLPPLPDDVVVAGTPQARAFEDAGIDVKLVRAETLLDEGFENDWLRELAPSWKPKPKPKPNSDKPAITKEEAATAAAEKAAKSIPPGRASARYDSENLGRGTPKPGGYRVVR
jgi:hypothetical protein